MAYAYYRTVTTDHTQAGSSDSTNFPVLVSFTDTTMKLVANGGHINNTVTSNGQTVCADLAFYSDSGLTSLLNFEIEFYDGTAGTVIGWVQLPTLSHTSNVVFYMAYDDASVTTFQGNVNGTWDSNFKMVNHWSDVAIGTDYDTTPATDSTSNGNTLGVHASAVAFGGVGEIGRGVSAPTSAAAFWVTVTSSLLVTADYTAACWLQIAITDYAFSNWATLGQWAASSGWMVYNQGLGSYRIYADGNEATWISAVPNDGAWHHVVGVKSGGNGTLYVDGSPISTQALGGSSITDSGTECVVMSYNSGGPPPNSPPYLLDQTELSNIARSTDWILAEYNSQKTSSTFLTVGSETPVTPSGSLRAWVSGGSFLGGVFA